MAKHLEIRQLLDCREDEFWERIFRSEEFNRYLYDGLGARYELQEWRPDTGYRRAKVWPTQQMPRALEHALGERLSFIEEGFFDADAERYDFRVLTSTATDRIRVVGSVMVEAVSPHQCERRVNIEIGANLLGLGHLIESYFVATTREQYAKNAALVNEYLASRR